MCRFNFNNFVSFFLERLMYKNVRNKQSISLDIITYALIPKTKQNFIVNSKHPVVIN